LSKIYTKIYPVIGKKILPKHILFNGYKIFLDSVDAINLSTWSKDFEPYEMLILKSEVKPGNVVIDVGANIGMYTLLATKLVGNVGKVYSFEPDPISFSNLKRNVLENNIENVVLINKAASSKTGTSKLSISPSQNQATRMKNYLIKDEINSKKYTVIETVSLDDFFENKSKKVDVIKMDIEGSEFEALKGMKNLIDKNDEIKLFFEFNPFTLNRLKVDIPKFLDYLIGFNFIIYHIDEEKKKKEIINKEWLLRFAENKNENHFTNLLCIKNLKA